MLRRTRCAGGVRSCDLRVRVGRGQLDLGVLVLHPPLTAVVDRHSSLRVTCKVIGGGDEWREACRGIRAVHDDLSGGERRGRALGALQVWQGVDTGIGTRLSRLAQRSPLCPFLSRDDTPE